MIEDDWTSLVDDNNSLWRSKTSRTPRSMSLYPSDRKEKMGIEKRDSIFHRPIRKVEDFKTSLFDRSPYKSKFRFYKK